jgi:hypothetical protein
LHERQPWWERRPLCRMEWVAVRTVEGIDGTTAETVETTGGTVGSEEFCGARRMTVCSGRVAG